MSFQEIVHILYFSFEVLVDICNVRHWLSSSVNDEAWTAWVGELVDTLVGNNFNEFHMTVLDSNGRQVLVDKVTELVAVLIQMENDKVLSWRIGNLPHVLIPGDLIHLPILDLLSLGLQLRHPAGIELFGEIILEIQIIFHFLKLLLIFLCEYIFEFVLLLMLLSHLWLLLVKGGLFLFF